MDVKNGWGRTKEKILMISGLLLIGFEAINSELLGGVFHFEFVIAGLALCGISLAQIGDKKG